jgi:hypothetical protein
MISRSDVGEGVTMEWIPAFAGMTSDGGLSSGLAFDAGLALDPGTKLDPEMACGAVRVFRGDEASHDL